MLLPPFVGGFVSTFRRDAVLAGYAQKDTVLTGVASGKKGTLSIWVKLDWTDAGSIFTARELPSLTVLGNLSVISGDVFVLTFDNVADATVVHLRNLTPLAHGATWVHLLFSWDMAVPGSGKCYVNDADDTNEVVFNNDTISYATMAEWDISFAYSGSIAELWFDPTSALDLTVSSNRRKFIDASGNPVFLGVDGSLPTGTAPAVYCSVVHSEAASTFATNKGTGGNFPTDVSFTLAATSPTDP